MHGWRLLRIVLGEPAEKPRPAERRAVRRQPARLRPAKLLGADGGFLADAVVLDRSTRGLRMRRFGAAVGVRAVLDERDGLLRRVRLAWTRGDECGFAVSGEAVTASRSLRWRSAGPYYAVSD